MKTYTPEKLDLWTLPKHYAGERWDGYYVFLGRHRDSRAMDNVNFDTALEAVGGETGCYDDQEKDGGVVVVREGHCLVGWVEWIAIHESCERALRAADEIMERLEIYPSLDDDRLSEVEMDEANEVWSVCYNDRQRIDYMRKHRSQFEFSCLSDMMACARGKFFAGYASDLIYG
jgi:hypothetical protein